MISQGPAPAADRVILLRYHEVALKGDNRGWFEERLRINARRLLARELTGPDGKKPPFEITHQQGRAIIHLPWSEPAREALQRVFGVTGISPARIVKTEKSALVQAAIEESARYFQTHRMPRSFRVETRRSDKALPEKSYELDRFIGGEIKNAWPELAVDLEEPEFTVGVEVRHHHSFIWTEKHPGPGGLPVETNGRVLALMSGGLDSPVAAIRSLRRGCATAFLHFYGTPFVGEESLRKVQDLVRLVNRYQPEPLPLLVVPFGKLQERIALATQPKLRTVLYRRMMLRVASAVAARLGAQALVTGESIGQVASQTLENLATINAVTTLPVLRPLSTYDKDEIIAEAKRWGTYETSIRPAADCCTLFADKHPSTRSTPALVEEQEKRFPVEELVEEALRLIEVHATEY